MIEAEVILKSVSSSGDTLSTVRYRAPRFILAEVKTHRVIRRTTHELDVLGTDTSLNADDALSRNARSSRAVPIERIIEEVERDPFIPTRWTVNRPGMTGEPASPGMVPTLEADWLKARDAAVECARALAAHNAHKQIVNRVLEPFMWVDGVISATNWNNFFALRIHQDAEPHMRILATKIRDAINAADAVPVRKGCWHIPYLLPGDEALPLRSRQFISAARLARVSYRAFDTRLADPDKDLERGKAMAQARPLHASPFEHIATPSGYTPMWGNFTGWAQFRRMMKDHEVSG